MATGIKTRWLIAKYIADLRRREPVNVGVILVHGDRVLSRFLGQRPDGLIDGRRVRWVRSVSNYKAWVEYWRSMDRALVESPTALSLGSNQNYLVEVGGERLLGAVDLDPESFVDQLFNTLVETGPERAGLSVAHLSESVLNRLEIGDKIIRNHVLEVERPSGAVDSVLFDYRFDNGAVSLMQRVALIHEDERSWDSAHAAAWSFERVAELQPRQEHRVQPVALVKGRATDNSLRRQVALLADLATVVDVGDEDKATAQLGDLLGVRSALVLR